MGCCRCPGRGISSTGSRPRPISRSLSSRTGCSIAAFVKTPANHSLPSGVRHDPFGLVGHHRGNVTRGRTAREWRPASAAPARPDRRAAAACARATSSVSSRDRSSGAGGQVLELGDAARRTPWAAATPRRRPGSPRAPARGRPCAASWRARTSTCRAVSGAQAAGPLRRSAPSAPRDRVRWCAERGAAADCR